MKRSMKTAMQLGCVGVMASVMACSVEAPEENLAEQHATAVLLDGKYYYETDSFHESCGLSALRVGTTAAGPTMTADDGHAYKVASIPRGNVTYVAPAHAVNGNGTIPWFCGSHSEWMECTGPESWVRINWQSNTQDVGVRCYARCGDGSSPIDCLPY